MDRLVWAASSTFRIDDLFIGVRSTSEAVDDVLRRTLKAHLVPEVEAPSNYSVSIGETGADGRSAGFHFLYRSSSAVVRTRDPERVVRALMAWLHSHREEQPQDVLRVWGTALISEHGAVVGPPAVQHALEVVERRLNSRGIRVVDAPTVPIDPQRSEVVVPEPDLEIDWSVLADLADAVPGPRRADPPVPPGRYPIVGWGFPVLPEQVGPFPRAHAITLGAQHVVNRRDLGAQATLDGLAEVIRRLQPQGLTWEKPSDMVAPLASLAGGP